MKMSYAVLGGGISGLSATFYLKNFGGKVLLIEGTDRLGGWINSFQNNNGSLFELGPRTLRVGGNAGANTLHLADMLNLEDQIIPVTYSSPAAKNRMIKVNNKLHKLPNDVKSALKRIPPFSKPLFIHLLKDLTASSVVNNDESVYSFAQRRFGSEIATFAVDPLCRGIFAGNAKDLSIMALSRRIYELEQKYNSVIKGLLLGRKSAEKRDPSLECSLTARAVKEKWSVWSLKGGLETLVKSLNNHLQNSSNVEILTETQVLELSVEKNKVTIVTDKETYIVDKVISCLPAYKLKEVVKNWNPWLQSLLNAIPYVSVGLVNLEYPQSIVKEPAFGYLVPSSESSKVLGVIYDSCVFPQEKCVLTVMMGGYWFEELFGNDPKPELLLNTALEEINSTFNTTVKPTHYKVSVLKNCIPQYSVGHFERVSNARKLIAGSPVYLAGNSFDGVGVNDAIYSSKELFRNV